MHTCAHAHMHACGRTAVVGHADIAPGVVEVHFEDNVAACLVSERVRGSCEVSHLGEHNTGQHIVGQHYLVQHYLRQHNAGQHIVGEHTVGQHYLGQHYVGEYQFGQHCAG